MGILSGFVDNLSPSERKRRPVFRGVMAYFPDALMIVSYVSQIGNDQHNPNEKLHWAKEKSSDEADALIRHLLEYSQGKVVDSDGAPVLGKIAWRALALLQREVDQDRQEKK